MIKIFLQLLILITRLILPDGLYATESGFPDFPELPILRQAYPDVRFSAYYDEGKQDWIITLQREGQSAVLYRADGRFLSEEQLSQKERFRMLIYRFPAKLADPADFTEEEIDRISRFGATENRKIAPVSGTALFDALYDSTTRESVEVHIRPVQFLGREIRVHERITGPLSRVEKVILMEAEGDGEVRQFVNSLGSAGGYAWRQIQDTSGRSFHSMGLAIDLLPVGWQSKVVYWNWEKNKGRTMWMLIPLSERWMPPAKVIDAFESEGFIWGGKWPVWDNMHFEYRPELIKGRILYTENIKDGYHR